MAEMYSFPEEKSRWSWKLTRTSRTSRTPTPRMPPAAGGGCSEPKIRPGSALSLSGHPGHPGQTPHSSTHRFNGILGIMAFQLTEIALQTNKRTWHFKRRVSLKARRFRDIRPSTLEWLEKYNALSKHGIVGICLVQRSHG